MLIKIFGFVMKHKKTDGFQFFDIAIRIGIVQLKIWFTENIH